MYVFAGFKKNKWWTWYMNRHVIRCIDHFVMCNLVKLYFVYVCNYIYIYISQCICTKYFLMSASWVVLHFSACFSSCGVFVWGIFGWFDLGIVWTIIKFICFEFQNRMCVEEGVMKIGAFNREWLVHVCQLLSCIMLLAVWIVFLLFYFCIMYPIINDWR